MVDTKDSVAVEFTEEVETGQVHVIEHGEKIFVDADEIELLSNGWVKCRNAESQKSKRYTEDHLLIPPQKVDLISVADTGHEPDVDFDD